MHACNLHPTYSRLGIGRNRSKEIDGEIWEVKGEDRIMGVGRAKRWRKCPGKIQTQAQG